MPRKARIDAPGALHHIIIRGIERRAIFKNAADRNDFFRLSRKKLLLWIIKKANGDEVCFNQGGGYGASETGSTGLLLPADLQSRPRPAVRQRDRPGC